MTTIEIIVSILLVISAIWGYQRGVIVQIGSLFAIVAAIVVCHIFGDLASTIALSVIGGEDVASDPAQSSITAFAAKCIGHVSLFLMVWMAVWFLTRTLKSMIRAVKLGFVDRIAGATFMALKCGLIISLIINFMKAVAPASGIATASGPVISNVGNLAPQLLGFLNL